MQNSITYKYIQMNASEIFDRIDNNIVISFVSMFRRKKFNFFYALSLKYLVLFMVYG